MGYLIKTERVSTSIHGRYLLALPDPGNVASIQGLLVGFHGYAQTADIMLKYLQQISALESWALCSVQGLHSFYNKSKEVVASWMTSLDRELIIEDNLTFVNKVLESVLAQVASPKQLIFLGFSQGVPMALRSAVFGAKRPNALIGIGGDIPPELDGRLLGQLPPSFFFRGTEDAIISASLHKREHQRLVDAGVNTRFLEYQGGHEWNADLGKSLSRILEESAWNP